jgi:hypothetical protein
MNLGCRCLRCEVSFSFLETLEDRGDFARRHARALASNTGTIPSRSCQTCLALCEPLATCTPGSNSTCIPRSEHYLLGMATKAERFRAEQQIESSQPKPKKPKAHKPAPEVNAATTGVTGTGQAQRNFKKRPKDGAALEVSSESSNASRKSTRSSAGRVKQATQLTRRQKRATNSPKERAVRAAARA